MTPAPMAPVWEGYCADPFVLVHDRGYVMFGSTPALLGDGRAFQTLHSTDLITWTDGGGALEPLPAAAADTEYWAPEVVAAEGRFWMYYSVGVGDTGHHLRVAVSDQPGGPFRDCGVDLTPDLPFAIDPSPFTDAKGQRWLYFATDRLEGRRPGTALAVAPLATAIRLGPCQVVLTAFADWQRYQAERVVYGKRTDWHTLEGPTVIDRRDAYWMTYSGGNWHDDGYGVGLATAPAPGGPWTPVGPGPAFLNSAASGLIGPGHNSVFTAHDGNEYAVFHAWNTERAQRRPHIAPITWNDDGPRIDPDPGCRPRPHPGPRTAYGNHGTLPLAPQRQRRILDALERSGGVRVSELSRTLGASPNTIRRDIDALARRGLIAKVYGGATPISGAGTEQTVLVFGWQTSSDSDSTVSLAATLVQPRTAIGIASGTAALPLAQHLLDIPELTVVTNSIPVAESFHGQPRTDRTVILTGGVRTPTDTLVGPVAVATLGALHLDLIFMDAYGMDVRGGLTTPRLLDAEVNRAFAVASRRVVVIAESTRCGVVGLHTIMPLDDVDVFVTDNEMPAHTRAAIGARVGEMLITTPTPTPAAASAAR